MTTVNEMNAQIEAKQSEIDFINKNISLLTYNIDTFEYECSEDEFDESLNGCHEAYNIGNMTFYPSDILKSCDPIAYRCSKSDYESNFDLDNCEEYTDMVEQLESLNNELEDLENELSDLQDELDNLESEKE